MNLREQSKAPRHLSRHRDRLEAAGLASAFLLLHRGSMDELTRAAAEKIALQQDDRLDVIAYTKRLIGEGGARTA